MTVSSAELLAVFGAAAIIAGNVVALRQQRLKLLVAYSTVAQIGYLFVMFPLAAGLTALELDASPARSAGLLQAISHALAKAAMFMAAGLIYRSVGHDRIAELAGTARAMPLTVLTFALAGIALMGLPPSGAYVAKKLFFDATAATGQGWLEIVLNAGAFLTASYTVLVIAHALRPAAGTVKLDSQPSRVGEVASLALAIASLLLGFVAAGMIPHASLSGAFTPAGLASAAGRHCGRRSACRRSRAATPAARRRRTRGDASTAAAGDRGRGHSRRARRRRAPAMAGRDYHAVRAGNRDRGGDCCRSMKRPTIFAATFHGQSNGKNHEQADSGDRRRIGHRAHVAVERVHGFQRTAGRPGGACRGHGRRHQPGAVAARPASPRIRPARGLGESGPGVPVGTFGRAGGRRLARHRRPSQGREDGASLPHDGGFRRPAGRRPHQDGRLSVHDG